MISRLKRLKLLLMDVDGVLTDGLIYHWIGRNGELVELKGVDTQDGMALYWLAANGVRTGVITGRVCDGFVERAKLLKMEFLVQGTVEKAPAFEKILRQAGVSASEAAFVGDDLTDIPAMRRAGLGLAVANARPEVKRAAHYVTRKPGGRGALREIAEMILKAQGRWAAIARHYEASLIRPRRMG
jgi:3-deoxy-D-manno-octulosonate 8-phosphate phosphatase (KDO 8-P phosphatase)